LPRCSVCGIIYRVITIIAMTPDIRKLIANMMI
jgi:hypothetical protein